MVKALAVSLADACLHGRQASSTVEYSYLACVHVQQGARVCLVATYSTCRLLPVPFIVDSHEISFHSFSKIQLCERLTLHRICLHLRGLCCRWQTGATRYDVDRRISAIIFAKGMLTPEIGMLTQ